MHNVEILDCLGNIKVLLQRSSANKRLDLWWLYRRTPDWEIWERLWDVIATRMKLGSLGLCAQSFGTEDSLNDDAPWVQLMLKVKNIRAVHMVIFWVATVAERRPGSSLC